MNIDKLAAQLVNARAEEATAKLIRIECEEAIIAQYDCAESGSQTIKTSNGLKLTIKTGLNYKAMTDMLPDDLKKTVSKTTLDEKAYEALRKSDPMEFSRVAQYVTTTPKKEAVSVAVI